VKELIDILGDAFDIEKEWNNLLMAITNATRTEFTGNHPSYRGFVSGQEKLHGTGSLTYDYNQFLTFRVMLGYVEFSTWNQETFETIPSDDHFFEDNQSAKGKYAAKPRWSTPTYKAYYLAISQIDQILFHFGELSYQDILGSTDFNTNFTIMTYKDMGDPIAIQAAAILDVMNEAWYKFRYEMRRAKPRGRGYNYDAMISRMMEMIPDSSISEFGKLQKVMELLDSSANEIYTFPVSDDGKTVMMPGNQLNYDIPNGISKESMLWWEIMMNCGKYLSDMLGIAPLREGDPGQSRDSMSNQFKALEYSQSATGYIPRMLNYLFQQMAVKSNFFAQDIVNYKKYNTVAYEFLEEAVGEETLNRLANGGKIAPHRFGIFVESLNPSASRTQLEQVLMAAIQNKTVTTAQYILIRNIKSPIKAFQTFAYFEQRNQKMAQKAQAQAAQQQMQQQQQQMQMQMQLEKMKIDGMLMGKKMDADSNVQAHLINQQGGITKTAMKVDADKENIYHEAQADFMREQASLSAGQPGQQPPPAMPQTNPALAAGLEQAQQGPGMDPGGPGRGAPPPPPGQ
jgi:hypothetical protein